MCSIRSALDLPRALLAILIVTLLTIGVPSAQAAALDIGCNVPELVNAINTANANSGLDTLNLATDCIYTLTAVDNGGLNGLPAITSEITINGNGATIARSAAPSTPAFRIFNIFPAGALALHNLTVTGGRTPDADPGQFGSAGGAIVNLGTLAIVDSVIHGNGTGAGGAGGSGGFGGLGGGIFNTGTLTMTNTTVSDNTTGAGGSGSPSGDGGGGGGIANSGALTLVSSTVSGNITGVGGSGASGGSGGGLFNTGTLVLSDSTVISNTTGAGGAGSYGGFGGGIYNSGVLTVSNSAVISNTTGDGNFSNFGSPGGGIYNGGALAMTSSTVSGNTAVDHGGGIYIIAGTLNLADVTITSNTADSDNNSSGDGGGVFRSGGIVTTTNTIVAGNSDTSGPNPDIGGTIVSQGFNLVGNVGDTNFSSNTTGDQYGDPNGATVPNTGATEAVVAIDPKLGALTMIGVIPPFHTLLAGSPAIDAGRCGAPTTDQRGKPRPFDLSTVTNAAGGDGCDIGAVEAIYFIVHLPLAIR